MRSAGKSLLVVSLLLVVNSAYIAAFGDANLFYVANALLHPFLGIVAGILFILFLRKQRNFLARSTGSLVQALLALSAVFGGYLMVAGMTRPNSWALYAHVALAIAGLAVLLIVWQSRLASGKSKIDNRKSVSFQFPTSSFERTAWRWSAAVMLGALGFCGAVAAYHRLRPDPQYIIRNPATPPLTMEEEGAGPNTLMFPSAATTTDGKPITSQFFMDSESCRECHADIYNQWNSSMHHMASFNNQWYRKSIEYMQDTIGVRPSIWCAGCHDHAIAFAGKMQKQHIREIVHTREAQNGLGCMSCHSIVHVKNTMGQGGFVMDYPPLDELAASKNPLLVAVHNYAVKLNPKPHRNAFLKPFHRDPDKVAEFCSTCHKVHLDVPVNNYRWIRGFNDYDNWQASGVSGQGARSFYYPPKPQNCADCHMPLVASNDFGNIDGKVHSHRFAAANTAVPSSYGDHEQIHEVEKFLKGSVTVDIFGLAESPVGALPEDVIRPGEGPQLASTFAVGEESAFGLGGAAISGLAPAKLVAPLGRVQAQVRRGDTMRMEVVVRTRRVGHFFPGGTVDAFDVWLELQARDDKGHIIYWSGKVADDGRGPVEPGAHFYRSLQLDGHGNPINKRNAWATRAVMYARLIPPGAADTAHFRIKIPEDCGEKIILTAKLNYRKFSWWNTQWAFGGMVDPADTTGTVDKSYDDRRWIFAGDVSDVSAKPKQIPNVPIITISEATQTIPVVGRNAPAFQQKLAMDAKDRERWNDYGIGLLLQGDLKGAERAFLKVTELEPGYADGWVNVARAHVLEGNTEAAKPFLAKALGLNPRLASAYYFTGLALKADGKYPEAFENFSKAAALYPRDRVVRNQMGRMLFLQRKYPEAVAELGKTLAVDPEDLEAHYNLMLCYRGLNNDALAAREEKLYLRFKADESSRAITGPYRLKSPHDNNEAQSIHEHVWVALGKTESSRQYSGGSKQALAGERSGLPRSRRAGGQSPPLQVARPSPTGRGWTRDAGTGEGPQAQVILNRGDSATR
ncbi:MAG: tetratricopeptide repeat protein [Acidobacteria bacterium]|nr:tetratricopeptide repeat protein [Acidobacteriota bacterium]